MAEKYNMCTATGGGPKKHPCPDCFFCQQCPDDRCSVCLREQKAARKKVKKKRGTGKKTRKKAKKK